MPRQMPPDVEGRYQPSLQRFRLFRVKLLILRQEKATLKLPQQPASLAPPTTTTTITPASSVLEIRDLVYSVKIARVCAAGETPSRVIGGATSVAEERE